jgi:hypothetical protein
MAAIVSKMISSSSGSSMSWGSLQQLRRTLLVAAQLGCPACVVALSDYSKQALKGGTFSDAAGLSICL